MDWSKRAFLKDIARLTAGAAAIGAASPASATVSPQGGDPRRHWAMVVDIGKCIGCQACTVACVMENRVPENQYRTFVSTYEVVDGNTAGTYVVPRLCNHCANPPCIPVCPTGATYQRLDGSVVVDSDRCVGCGYCVQVCPYDARFINHITGTADKCTFCVQRTDAGLLPACVETCVGGARLFGNLDDRASTLRQVLDAAGDGVKVLKPEQHTQPTVYYIGLDTRFQGRVEGQPALWHPIETEGTRP